MTDTATTESTPVAPTLEQVAAEVWGSDASTSPAAGEPEKLDGSVEVKAPESPKDPKDERVGSRIAAAKKAEQRAERERIEIRQQKEAQERRQTELDAREKTLRLIEEDPVRFFEVAKVDPKKFLDKLAGDYKPENLTNKELADLRAEVTQLREQATQRDQATQQAQARAQADGAWKEASASFVAHVGEQAEKYPHLTEEFTEDQATEKAYEVLTETVGRDAQGRPISRAEAYRRQYGEYPDHDVVAEYLDALAKQSIESRSKSAWRKRGDGAAPAGQAHGETKPVPPVKGTSPRTLTSRDASQRSAAPKPWSQEAADEESIRILEAAFRKKS